jgi:hypothetical protein
LLSEQKIARRENRQAVFMLYLPMIVTPKQLTGIGTKQQPG